MKALLSITASLAMAAMLAPVSASAGTIVGSPHDFSTVTTPHTDPITGPETTWNFRGNELCRVCHIPHDNESNPGALDSNGNPFLLWNHTASSQAYTPYAIYSSFTDNLGNPVATPVVGQPDGISKLCLGCHDGTVALDDFDKNVGGAFQGTTTFISDMAADALIPATAGDLRRTHPISVTYDDALYVHGQPEFKSASTTFGNSGSISDILDQGEVQCSSCHDVHNQEAVAGSHLLRVAVSAANDLAAGMNPPTYPNGLPSHLCLSCHNK